MMGNTSTKRQTKRERELAADTEVLARLVAETERQHRRRADTLEYVMTTDDPIEMREAAISLEFRSADQFRWDGRRDPSTRW